VAITYTLGGLKSIIADDLARSDLTTQIDDAITTAITNLKVKRFYFNETRTATFDTVADQATYTSSDDADIPLMLTLDGLTLEDSDGNRFDLGLPIDPVQMQLLQASAGAASGQPVEYTYFDQGFTFYPIPDGVYTITPIGHIEVAAPATDGEADNVWMTKAFELVRSEAKAYLQTHVIKNDAEAAKMVDAAQGAESTLNRATSIRRATGQIVPTAW
jgi:hypothetical protein